MGRSDFVIVPCFVNGETWYMVVFEYQSGKGSVAFSTSAAAYRYGDMQRNADR